MKEKHTHKDLPAFQAAWEQVNDRFLMEAYHFCPVKTHRKTYVTYTILASMLCLSLLAARYFSWNMRPPVTVYAYGTNTQLTESQTVTSAGTISDSGEMNGIPLMFYVLGENIKSIRFSCKNEWIEFIDWTEKRASYGLSKNFTVPYGCSEEDYYYLVIYWRPNNLLQKLQKSNRIADLAAEEKNDLIVMEITDENGRCHTQAIELHLSNDGRFHASVRDYKIRPEDHFISLPDSQPIKHMP